MSGVFLRALSPSKVIYEASFNQGTIRDTGLISSSDLAAINEIDIFDPASASPNPLFRSSVFSMTAQKLGSNVLDNRSPPRSASR